MMLPPTGPRFTIRPREEDGGGIWDDAKREGTIAFVTALASGVGQACAQVVADVISHIVYVSEEEEEEEIELEVEAPPSKKKPKGK